MLSSSSSSSSFARDGHGDSHECGACPFAPPRPSSSSSSSPPPPPHRTDTSTHSIMATDVTRARIHTDDDANNDGEDDDAADSSRARDAPRISLGVRIDVIRCQCCDLVFIGRHAAGDFIRWRV
jgi:hypothetical protein